MWRLGTLLLILLLSLPTVSGQGGGCRDPAEVLGYKFAGYAERTPGGTVLSVGDSFVYEDLNVTLTKVFPGNASKVKILRNRMDYVETGIEAGEDNELRRPDFLLELHSSDTTSETANLSFYTPYRANLTIAVTQLLIGNTSRTAFYPSERGWLELSLINTGEIEAQNIVVTPLFGDFQIEGIETPLHFPSLCGFNSSFDKIGFVLIAPDVTKAFNYSLIFQIDYDYENTYLGTSHHFTDYHVLNVTLELPEVSIQRGITPFNLSTIYKEDYPRVWVIINNGAPPEAISGNGSFKPSDPEPRALNIRWQDPMEPEFRIVSGTNHWEGDLANGTFREFTYRPVSEVPMVCSTISNVTYEDRYGNRYISFSNNQTLRFLPFPTVEKRIHTPDLGTAILLMDPIHGELNGKDIWRLNATSWFDYGNRSVILDSSPNVTINRTADVRVTLRNIGNAPARNLRAFEDIDGLRVTSGTTGWEGDLGVGEEAVYTFSVRVTKTSTLRLHTNVSYEDADIVYYSRNTSAVQQRVPSYCIRDRVRVALNQTVGFLGLYPHVTLNQTYGRAVERFEFEKYKWIQALSGFEFDYNLTIKNNGSDSVKDVLVRVEIPELEGVRSEFGGVLIKGEKERYIRDLEAQFFADLNQTRTGVHSNVTLNYTFLLPPVEKDTNYTLRTTVQYTDFFGEVKTIQATTLITAHAPLQAYLKKVLEAESLTSTIDYANETNIGEYSQGFIRLSLIELAEAQTPLLRLSIPKGLAFGSNDSRWEGGEIVETLEGTTGLWTFRSGNLTWEGEIQPRGEVAIPFLLTGKKAGIYRIPYRITYRGGELTSFLEIKVRGASIELVKEVDRREANVSEAIGVTLTAKNIGEDSAFDVVVTDKVPASFEVSGETTTSAAELAPGEVLVLEYLIRSKDGGTYTLEGAQAQWNDRIGNVYSTKTEAVSVEIYRVVPEEEGLPPEGEEELRLTRSQIFAVALILLAVLGIIVNLLLKSLSSVHGEDRERKGR
jgi:uncharacterized repeat protein (TIGR01451 family)